MNYEVTQSDNFRAWLKGLDKQTRSRLVARIDRVKDGNFGDHQSVGKRVSELRFFFGDAYRIYYTIRATTQDTTSVILLCGGTKTSQKRDIEHAQQMAEELP
jgi:putative addiction module killer protein